MVTRKHAASVALIVILPSLILTICAPSHAATYEVVASETVDLALHMFAHIPMPGNTAANYDPAYVARIEVRKRSLPSSPVVLNLVDALASVAPRFAQNMNFQALTVVPVAFASARDFIRVVQYCANGDASLIKDLSAAERGTAQNLKRAFSPADQIALAIFAAALERGYETFYRDYWRARAFEREKWRSAFERFWEGEGYPAVASAFTRRGFAKDVVVLSEGMRRNGRGVGLGGVGGAIVKLPENEEEIEASYFTAVHEMTHALSNPIVLRVLGADPRQHNTSQGDRAGYQLHVAVEAGAILADYWIFKNAGGDWPERYLRSVARWFGSSRLSEAEFLRMFGRPNAFAIPDKLAAAIRGAFAGP